MAVLGHAIMKGGTVSDFIRQMVCLVTEKQASMVIDSVVQFSWMLQNL